MTSNNGLLKFDCAELSGCISQALFGYDFMSQPFNFSTTVQVDKQDLKLDELIGLPATITLGKGDLQQCINGLIFGYHFLKILSDDKVLLQLSLQPQLSFLDIEKHNQIFAVDKPMSIIDIVKAIFKQNNLTAVQWNLTKSYPKLTVCVQYNETDFNFVQRLLLDAGISYYFTHNNDSHTMVLTDAPVPKQGEKQSAQLRNDNIAMAKLMRFGKHIGYHSGMFNSHIVNFAQPDTKQTSKKTQAAPLAEKKLEHFHYGDHHPDATQTQLDKTNQQKLTADALRVNYFSGDGCFPNWLSATHFSLTNHNDSHLNGEYYLAGIVYQVTGDSMLNKFIAYHTEQAFVPMARLDCHDRRFEFLQFDGHDIELEQTQRPVLYGLYPATVVGPQGKSIYTDKYGRVKVQFAWDSLGKNDENSFAWVRVKQPWAGADVGFYATPRIGHEVVISFDHGDPHKPYIIGSLPNDNAMPPFTPEKTPWKSGFQSKSLDPNAPAPGGHQFIFDDNAKNPAINIHAQRDMQLNAGHNLTHHIKGKHHTTVQQGDHRHVVGGTLTIEAKKAIHLVNGQSRISITDTDIIVEADQIEIGAGDGAVPNVQAPDNDGIKQAMAAAQAAVNQAISESKANETAKKVLEKAFPAVSFDLDLMVPIEGIIVFEDKPYTYKASLSGSVTLQKKGTHPIGEFSKDGYKIEAKNTLGNFFSTMTLHPTSHAEMVLGSEVTGEFVTTKFQYVSTNHIKFESSPESLEETFSNWKIEGDLAFTIDLYSELNDPPPLPLVKKEIVADIKHQWHNIQESVLITGVIAIGTKLMAAVEEIEPELMSIA